MVKKFKTVLGARALFVSAALLFATAGPLASNSTAQRYDQRGNWGNNNWGNNNNWRNNNYYNGERGNMRGGGYDQRYRQDDRDHHHHGGGIGPGYGALIGGGGGALLGAAFGGGAKGALIGGAAGAGLGALGGKLAQDHNHHHDRYRHDGYYR